MRRLTADIKRYWKYIKFASKMDLESEVNNAYLDWLWWILEPVCNMLIYYFVFGIIFHNQEKYYLVFIYSGITLWTFFNKMLTQSVKAIKESRAIICKVYLPKPVILLQKMGVNSFKMAINCLIVVVLMIPYRIQVDYHLLLLIPLLIVFFIFTYGCSCFVMHFGVYIEDLSYIIAIGLRMVFYFTGVFYTVSTKIPQPFGEIFEKVNPMAFFIAATRNSLMYKSGISGGVFLVWFIISCLLAVMGTKLIYRNENNYVKEI